MIPLEPSMGKIFQELASLSRLVNGCKMSGVPDKDFDKIARFFYVTS